MVFKFLKELVEAAKEGVAEARDEAAQEAAAEERQKSAEFAEQHQELMTEDHRADFHYTSFGAPYRRVFVGDSLPDLVGFQIPEAKKADVAELIERDFEVTDRDSLEALASGVTGVTNTAGNQDLLALWTSRLSWATAASAGLGYITRDEAIAILSEHIDPAKKHFTDWKAFGDAFVRGDKIDGSNNVLGRKVLSAQIGLLKSLDNSPWNLRDIHGVDI